MKNKSLVQALGAACFLIMILIVSITLFNFKDMGNRRVLYFDAIDGSGLYMESRRIVEYSPVQGRDVDVSQFVQELLLGPATNGFRLLFPLDTRIEACFIQDEVLFINLSKEAMFPGETALPTKEAVDLLIYNIEQNFSWIKSIEIYIGSNKVYENVV